MLEEEYISIYLNISSLPVPMLYMLKSHIGNFSKQGRQCMIGADSLIVSKAMCKS